MDPEEILRKIATPEDCDQFGVNVAKKFPQLALKAARRAVELRAKKRGARNAVEREAFEAVYAYEAALTREKGGKTRATRTWQMIERHGVLKAMEKAVDRPDDAAGYKVLQKMGLIGPTFEEVIVRNPDSFSPSALARSKERLSRYNA